MLDNANGPLAVLDCQFVCVVRDDPAVGPYIWIFQYIAVDVFPICGDLSKDADHVTDCGQLFETICSSLVRIYMYTKIAILSVAIVKIVHCYN